MKENLKKLKVDCKYEFLYNKLPLPTDFYYKMKDAFLWIMKVDVGDTMSESSKSFILTYLKENSILTSQ